MKHEGDKNRKIWMLLSSVPFSDVVALYGIAGVMLQFFSTPKQVNVTVGILGVLLLVLTILAVIIGNSWGKRVKTSEAGIHKKDVCVSTKTVHEEKKSISGVHKGIGKWLNFFICFAVVVAITGTVYLYLTNNSDFLRRAKAGDVFAQVYVADYYHELGNEEDCLYWYMIASDYNDRYGCVAKNNLAYLYWQKHKSEGDLEDYLPRIYSLLKESALGGNKTGMENLYWFTYYYEFSYESSKDDERTIFNMLVDKGFITDIEHYREEVWEDAGLIVATTYAYSSDRYTRYTIRATTGGLDPNDNTKLKTYYTYSVIESNLKPDKMILKYDSSVSGLE